MRLKNLILGIESFTSALNLIEENLHASEKKAALVISAFESLYEINRLFFLKIQIPFKIINVR